MFPDVANVRVGDLGDVDEAGGPAVKVDEGAEVRDPGDGAVGDLADNRFGGGGDGRTGSRGLGRRLDRRALDLGRDRLTYARYCRTTS